jgi:hypothetical protein
VGEVGRGRWAHGRDLARLYERLRKNAELLKDTRERETS